MTRRNVHRHPVHQRRIDDEHARWARRARIDAQRRGDCHTDAMTALPDPEPQPEPDDDEDELDDD